MNLVKFIKPMAACTAVVVLVASISGCGWIFPKTPEPTRSPSTDTQSKVSLDDRKEADNGYGYKSLDSEIKKTAYSTIGEYMKGPKARSLFLMT